MNFQTFNDRLSELFRNSTTKDPKQNINNTIEIHKFIVYYFKDMTEKLEPDEVFSCKEFSSLFIKNIDVNIKNYKDLHMKFSNASGAILWMDVAKLTLEAYLKKIEILTDEDEDNMPGPYDDLPNVEKSGLIHSDTYEGMDGYDN